MNIYEELFVLANHALDLGKSKLGFRLLMESAAGGYIYAFNSLGLCYDKGEGVKKDSKKALYWYKKAAQKGDVCACWNIALTYRDKGKDEQAKIWFKKVLDKGDHDSYLELAKLLLKHKQGAPLAIKYLKLAIKAKRIFEDGRAEAKQLLDKLESSIK